MGSRLGFRRDLPGRIKFLYCRNLCNFRDTGVCIDFIVKGFGFLTEYGGLSLQAAMVKNKKCRSEGVE